MHHILIRDISDFFQIPEPQVNYQARRRNACYVIKTALIRISGRYNETEVKAALVHELGHHVDHCLNKDRRYRSSHDETFFKILVDLVNLAYETVEEYPWHREYRTIYKWACRKGYSKPGLGWNGQPISKRKTMAEMLVDVNFGGTV